jgi:hypothetical protein
MQLVRSDRPFLAYNPGRTRSFATWRTRAERMVYRCPVEGCPRVAAMPGEETPGEYHVANEEAFA